VTDRTEKEVREDMLASLRRRLDSGQALLGFQRIVLIGANENALRELRSIGSEKVPA